MKRIFGLLKIVLVYRRCWFIKYWIREGRLYLLSNEAETTWIVRLAELSISELYRANFRVRQHIICSFITRCRIR